MAMILIYSIVLAFLNLKYVQCSEMRENLNFTHVIICYLYINLMRVDDKQ